METRYITRKRFLRKSIVVLQVKEVRHRMEPIGGTGHYDEWDEVIWRDAHPDDFLPPRKKQPFILIDNV